MAQDSHALKGGALLQSFHTHLARAVDPTLKEQMRSLLERASVPFF